MTFCTTTKCVPRFSSIFNSMHYFFVSPRGIWVRKQGCVIPAGWSVPGKVERHRRCPEALATSPPRRDTSAVRRGLSRVAGTGRPGGECAQRWQQGPPQRVHARRGCVPGAVGCSPVKGQGPWEGDLPGVYSARLPLGGGGEQSTGRKWNLQGPAPHAPPCPAPRPCRGLARCGPMREAVPLASGAGPVKPPQPGTLKAPSGRPLQPGGEDRLSAARPSGRCGRVAGPAVHRTCNVQGALLQGGGHGPVLPAQQGAAAPLGHFLLQPGPQLQVGLGGCVERGPVTQGRHRQPCRWCCGVMSSRVGQGPRGLWADHLPSVSPRGRTEHAHTLATSLRHRIMCALAGLPHEARAVARTL